MHANFIKMLIKGKVIHQNIKKEKKLLDNEMIKSDNGTYYLLLELLEKKQKKYDKAIEYFEKSMNEGNYNAIFEYGTMLYEGNGISSNIKDAFDYYQKAANNGCTKALFLMGKILKIDNDILMMELNLLNSLLKKDIQKHNFIMHL